MHMVKSNKEENRNFFGSLSFYLIQVQQIAGQGEPQPDDAHVMYHLIIENSDEFTSRFAGLFIYLRCTVRGAYIKFLLLSLKT